MGQKKTDTSRKPYISNYPVLDEWLRKHGAFCQWQLYDHRHERQSVEGWMFGSTLAIIVVHADGHGWDIFTPCSNTEVVATFDDAEKRLGLKPSTGSSSVVPERKA